jgi:hypothetical protein
VASASPGSVRRAAAAIIVVSGALSLVAAAAPAAGNGIEASAVLRIAPTPGPAADASPLSGAVALSDPDRRVADAAGLIKAVQLAEEQNAQAEAERQEAELLAVAEAAAAVEEQADQNAPEDGAVARDLDGGCDASTGGLGAVKSWVRDAAEVLSCRFGEPEMFGVAGRGGPSDHPAGLALDFMVDRATGDAMAACVLENMDALSVKYVIWRQRINTGDGWEAMEDRGGATANHMDHVHISFEAQAGSGAAAAC